MDEENEEKDLALAERVKEFEILVLQERTKLKAGEERVIPTNIKGLIIRIEKQEDELSTTLDFYGVEIGRINEMGDLSKIEYNKEKIKLLLEAINEQAKNGRPLPIEQETMQFLDYVSRERERDEDKKESIGDTIDEEHGDEQKADVEKPSLKEPGEEPEEIDEAKAEIAKKYNLNVKQVVHIAKDEKVTKDHRFDGLVNFAEGYDDIFILQGDDPYSWKTIGVKDGEQEEIENSSFRQMEGKNPDVTIKRVDGEQIDEIRPLAIYEIDSRSAVAIVKNAYGEPEALYCRQEGGDEKVYWGSVIPEASGKNVLQEPAKTREIVDGKCNSGRDLAEKGEELNIASNLEKRGIPSEKEGVQVEEIDGTRAQNRQYYKEQIKEDLYNKLGIDEKMKNVMPGYLEYMDNKIDEKAEKILRLMEENEDITYEEAVERVEKSENKREIGGAMPGEKALRGPKRR